MKDEWMQIVSIKHKWKTNNQYFTAIITYLMKS